MIGDFLSNRLKKSIQKNMKKSILTKEGIEPSLREIKINLLEADVNIEVVNDLIKKIKSKSLNKGILNNANPSQMMIKIVHTEIKDILGKSTSFLNLSSKPNIFLVAGLQGSGKTTTVAKLATYVKRKKHYNKILLVACDVYRPAAIEQLKQLSQNAGVDIFEKGLQSPIKTITESLIYANKYKYDLVIIDTAGRTQVDQKLMDEIKQIKKISKPNETLLVVDGMIGQEIIPIISSFNNAINLSGVIVTKLDGSSRGGSVLSITHMTNIPIKFIGTGENLNNLELFHPKRMADRILGMGDIDTLFEKFRDNIDDRTIKVSMRRMMSGQFDLQDYLNQLKQMKKMGKMSSIMKLIPNSPKISAEKLDSIQRKLNITEIILNSTTIKERREPKLLKYLTRKQRVIKGSGRTEKEFNELMNQYEKIKKKIDEVKKQMISGNMPKFNGAGMF